MQTLIFDLDGTLTDPVLGITNSVLYALEKMGRPCPPREELLCFIGPPLLVSFTQFLGMTEDEGRQAIRFYREYYADRGLFENRPYDEAAETLRALAKDGYTLAVATSKPEGFARQILERFDMAPSFRYIAGASMDESRLTKEAVLRYLFDALHLSPEEAARTCLMIGDRRHDVEGAHAVGIPAMGVLWGYGSAEEMHACRADYVVRSFRELRETVHKI